MSVTIIGNGIIGMMTAYRLLQADPHMKITIVGNKGRPGAGSTAAAAMLNSFGEVENSTLVNPMERERFLFNKSNNKLWPDLLTALEQQSGLKIRHGFGTYIIKNMATDELEDDNFEAIIDALETFEEPHSEVNARNIDNYKPANLFRSAKAVYINREGWLNPLELLNALDVILKNGKNVVFLNQHCVSIFEKKGRVESVQLEDSTTIAVDRLVLCNGAEFTKLIDHSNLSIQFQRVFYGMGSTLLLSCPENSISSCIRTPNRGLSCGIYALQQSANHVIVGATSFISHRPEYEVRVTSIYSLLKATMEQINSDYYRSGVVRINIGWRAVTSDTLPLIGPTSLNNLYIATGTRRDGMHCSPIISQFLCDTILHGKSDISIAAYKPERLLTRIYTREEAIKRLIRHSINVHYQHDYRPSKDRMSDNIAAYYEKEFNNLHDSVGAFDWGIPVEMKDMYKYGHVR